jgi:predicted nucleotidyltransferase
MGGGGGRFFSGRSDPSELARRVRAAEAEASESAFQAQVGELLAQALAQFNDRDVQKIQATLEKVKADLADHFEVAVGLVFGGSVAKRTYVDGLSDVDALVILRPEHVAGSSPADLLGTFTEILRARYGRDKVQAGRLAVTIEVDGQTIQLLPAKRSEDVFQISNERGTGWSLINPQTFAERLSRSNQELDSKLVPTIKLAKAIVSQLSEQQRLSGYHTESLAINIFRGYQGPKTPKAMVGYFFERAQEQVKSPIKDSTGQSVHVDEDLGPADSLQRRIIADALGRVARKIANADGAQSLDVWRQILGL